MNDRTGVVYTKNKTEVLSPIGLSVVSHENHTRQRFGQLYRCGLHRKPY